VAYGGVWYDVFGNKCAEGRPSPGCNFYSNGAKIRDWEDPYWAYGHTLIFNNSLPYKDSYGAARTYSGWAWISGSGIIYDDFGFALNKATQSESFDVVANAAEQDFQLIQEAASDLADRHNLPLDVAMNITTSLDKIARDTLKQNSFTEESKHEYVTKIYGVSYESAVSALTKAKDGDLKELHDLNGEVSNYWKVNKETSETLLKSWHMQQLEAEDFKI
jgi:phage gp36-like protein